jgi:hypothetical protein
MRGGVGVSLAVALSVLSACNPKRRACEKAWSDLQSTFFQLQSNNGGSDGILFHQSMEAAQSKFLNTCVSWTDRQIQCWDEVVSLNTKSDPSCSDVASGLPSLSSIVAPDDGVSK